ncbi:MAG: hypothetical protein E4H01_09375 [Lysobacterales bacterium]|nr:MAG: hypothetical protein E4H01_09375 [Xanthomonadales bacterium]
MFNFRRILPWVSIAFSPLLVFLTLSAGLIGVDPDMRWGLFRRALFLLGAVGLLGTTCLQWIRVLDQRLISRSDELEGTEPALESRPKSSQMEIVSIKSSMSPHSKPLQRWIALAAVTFTVVVIGITYVGLKSGWRFTQRPATNGYYGMLGEAFTQGKTYLPIDPDPGLANLRNPYSPAARSGLNVYDGNLTYYQGKYYIYWGPAPALILAILKILGAPPFGDDVVSFIAVSVISLVSSLIIFRLKSIYFKGLPLWLMVAGLVVVATIHPMLWSQNSAGILSAAIASGQAFLLGGVYFMINALTKANARTTNCAAAGALWALAMASRLTIVTSVIVLLMGVTIILFRRIRQTHTYKIEVVNMLSLLAAFGLILGLLGWYNQIRFGSPFETGFRYTLAAEDKNVQLASGTLFSVRYLVPNTLNYLFAPIRLIPKFPYLRAVYSAGYAPFNALLPRLGVPADYTVEDANGLVFAAPALLFALIFARKWLYDEITRVSGNDSPVIKATDRAITDQGPLGSLLLFSGLAGALPVFLIFHSTTRYEMDFVPLLAIVAVLGMWRLYEDTRPYPIQSRLATGAILLFVIAGTLVSLLLAVSGAGSNFDDLNPSLFSFLVNFFPHW